MPRSLSILLIYLAAIGLFVLLSYAVGPVLQRQINSLIHNTPGLIDAIRGKVVELQNNEWVNRILENSQFSVNDISDKVTNYLSKSASMIGTSVTNFIGVLTNIIMVFVTVPFILYYMLKEGEKAPKMVLRLLQPTQRKTEQKFWPTWIWH